MTGDGRGVRDEGRGPGAGAGAAAGERPHWLVRPETVRGLWIGFGAVLAVLVAADLFVHGHPGFGVDGAFGFYAWYGLGTCVVMVLAAKGLGFFLKRPDGYYGEGGGDGAPDGAPGGPGRQRRGGGHDA